MEVHFFIKNKSKISFELGDISPDYNPTWIMDFPEIFNLNKIKKKNIVHGIIYFIR